VTLAERLPHPMPAGLFGGRFPIPSLWFLLAYSKTAGVVLDWFRDRFAGGASAADMDREAQSSPLGAAGLTMLPHFDGTVSPVPRPQARGAFAGISLGHTRADFYRAALEALAFSLRECLEHLAAAGFPAGVLRAIGGGARSDFWLQMKADVTGLAVEKPAVTEAAALGAAMLAACGVREFDTPAAASQALYARERVFEPDPARNAAYAEPFARYRRLMAALYGPA
jgi:xylulokinase